MRNSEGLDATKKSKVAVFASWHRTESLWREIYARTVATLAAAFVAYIFAVIGGYTPFNSLVFLLPFVLIALSVGGVALGLAYREVARKARKRGHKVAIRLLIATVTPGIVGVFVIPIFLLVFFHRNQMLNRDPLDDAVQPDWFRFVLKVSGYYGFISILAIGGIVAAMIFREGNRRLAGYVVLAATVGSAVLYMITPLS